jgi:hypothetical protein
MRVGLEFVVTQLHQQDAQSKAHGDGVSDDDRPGHEQDAVDEPQCHASCEDAIHRQRNTAHVFRAKSQKSLRQEAEGGQAGGEAANQVCCVHEICYKLVSVLRIFYAGNWLNWLNPDISP